MVSCDDTGASTYQWMVSCDDEGVRSARVIVVMHGRRREERHELEWWEVARHHAVHILRFRCAAAIASTC